MAVLSNLSGRWQVEQLRFSGSVGRGFWGAHLHRGLCLQGIVNSVLEMSLGRGRRRAWTGSQGGNTLARPSNVLMHYPSGEAGDGQQAEGHLCSACSLMALG